MRLRRSALGGRIDDFWWVGTMHAEIVLYEVDSTGWSRCYQRIHSCRCGAIGRNAGGVPSQVGSPRRALV